MIIHGRRDPGPSLKSSRPGYIEDYCTNCRRLLPDACGGYVTRQSIEHGMYEMLLVAPEFLLDGEHNCSILHAVSD